MTEIQKQYLEDLEMNYEFHNILPLVKNEYKALLHALQCEKWTLIDCIRESTQGGNGTHNPVTFADYEIVDGERVSVDP